MLELRFERRRYGPTTYTWVEVKLGDTWYSLGDPWPCIRPKASEIAESVTFLKTRLAAGWRPRT